MLQVYPRSRYLNVFDLWLQFVPVIVVCYKKYLYLDSVPGTHLELTTFINSGFKGSDGFFWPLQSLHTCDTQTYRPSTYIHKMREKMAMSKGFAQGEK